MDERDLWLEISNSCAATVGRHSRLLPRIRNSSAIVDIRRRSGARHAGKPKRTNRRAGEAADISAVHPRVHLSSVQAVGSRPRSPSSPEATVLCTAKTAFRAGRAARGAAAAKVLAEADAKS